METILKTTAEGRFVVLGFQLRFATPYFPCVWACTFALLPWLCFVVDSDVPYVASMSNVLRVRSMYLSWGCLVFALLKLALI